MIRFSNISASSLFGKALRCCLRVVPPNWAIPVLQGPLRGVRWIVGAQTHGMWLGSYEAEKQVALADALRAGQVFFDIGANTGFFSLLGARCVGPSGTVVAVEPLPRNVDFINRHCALNGVHNILVVPKAVADFEGSARFLEDGLSTSHLSLDGTMSVEVITLDRLAKELNLTPDVMKIDVEGAEAALLLGARHLLRTARPLVFLAVHTEDLYHEILEILPTVGYVATPLLPATARTEFLGEIVLTPQ